MEEKAYEKRLTRIVKDLESLKTNIDSMDKKAKKNLAQLEKLKKAFQIIGSNGKK